MKPLQSILLVEDDPDIREIAQMTLEALGGYQVAVAASGLEALAIALNTAPDLVLMDYMMPGMDGGQVLAGLREMPTLAQTPVVFLTAKVRPEEVDRLKSMGAVDVIAKPFEPTELPVKLEAIWAAKAKSIANS
ncbi:MAG: response regulator [Sphingomonadales bacterium]